MDQRTRKIVAILAYAVGGYGLLYLGYRAYKSRKALAGVDEDRAMAARSLSEEERAINDYQARADVATDPKLRQIFLHNRREEITHAKDLRTWLAPR